MVITIGGNVGAGKTTVAARLAKALGYEELYIGGLMREIAAERRMTIEGFYEKLKSEPDLERSIDERQRKLMREKDNLIVQGRIAWYFAKQSLRPSFNIFLKVNPEAGAERAGKRPENAGRRLHEILEANESRAQAEHERYRELYQIEDFLDPRHYDFVLDTTRLTEEEVSQKILAALSDRLP